MRSSQAIVHEKLTEGSRMNTTNPFEGFTYNSLKLINIPNYRPSFAGDPANEAHMLSTHIERRRGITATRAQISMDRAVPSDISPTGHSEYITDHAFAECMQLLTCKPLFKFATANSIPFTLIPTKDLSTLEYRLEYVLYPSAEEVKEWNELCVVNRLQSSDFDDYHPLS